MQKKQAEFVNQVAYAKDRLMLLEELLVDSGFSEWEQVFVLSNLIDETIMVLGNVGIGIREVCRKEQERSRIQKEEEESTAAIVEELANLLQS